MIALANQWIIQLSLDCLGRTCLVPSLKLARRVQKRKLRKKESEKTRSKESSHGCSWELVALYSTLQVFGRINGSISVCFKMMPKRFREFPEMKMYLPARRLMGSWSGVTLLLPGALYRWLGGPAWCPWGCPYSRSEPGVVGTGVWWW